MPKKPDDLVGQSQGPIAGGGRQTPEQEAMTGQSGGGLTDAERGKNWKGAGEPGRPPAALGGSSQGQSDRMPAGGGSVSNETASNPAATPGREHGTS